MAKGGCQSRVFGRAVMAVPVQTQYRRAARAAYSWSIWSSRLPGSGWTSTGRVASPAADTAAGETDPSTAGGASSSGGGGAGTGIGWIGESGYSRGGRRGTVAAGGTGGGGGV